MFDILIKNGFIIDGTQNHGFYGDIAIKDGLIVEIKDKINKDAKKYIDATDLIVSPGFIDVHSHNDIVPLLNKNLENVKLKQGVTTEIVGQCGLGVVPCDESINPKWKEYIKGVVGCIPETLNFSTVEEYIDQLNKIGLKNNYAMLISQGAIRTYVMGFEKKKPSENQLAEMCKILEESLKKGALGLSLGLQYIPGIFSHKEELIELCKIVKKYDGIVMIHLRNHDRTITNALMEIIDIAEESEVKIHISHMRSYNSKELGCTGKHLVDLINQYVNKGINITFDEHLYLSGSTLLTQLLPPWFTKEGNLALIENLKDNNKLEKLKEEIKNPKTIYEGWDNYALIAGWDGILLTSLNQRENLKYLGRTVGEISKEMKINPVDFIAKLLIEENLGVGIVTLNIFSEDDTIELIKDPLQMVGSDSIPAGVPHPRLYGNYPLFIGKYIRDKQAITLEEGIYKATMLPAKTLGITDRGQLQSGKIADITIFKYEDIRGYEDYFNPTREPEGIIYVIINGKIVLEDKKVTLERPGKFITKIN